MGVYLYIDSADAPSADYYSRSFTTEVWFDNLGVFQQNGLVNPYRYPFNPVTQREEILEDSACFAQWFDRSLVVLQHQRNLLPTLYATWRNDRSDVGYFFDRGQLYALEGCGDMLYGWPVKRLPDEIRRNIDYEPPQNQQQGVNLLSLTQSCEDRDGKILLNGQEEAIHRLFAQTPIELESANYLDFYNSEFVSIRTTMQDALQSKCPLIIGLFR